MMVQRKWFGHWLLIRCSNEITGRLLVTLFRMFVCVCVLIDRAEFDVLWCIEVCVYLT